MKSCNPELNATGISFIISFRDSLLFTPTATIIYINKPIKANVTSLNANLKLLPSELAPVFIIAIPISLPASKPINTQVVLIGT